MTSFSQAQWLKLLTKGQLISKCPFGVIVLLSYDLTTFQILGQKLSNFFVGILVQTMTTKGHFEIN